MPLAAGTRLGPYEILAPAGAGGMGEVYRSKDTRLDRIVAIKVLPLELSTPELRQRFEQEARAISNLSHPNICGLYDVGHQDGVDFLVLEYLEGETLESRLRRGPLPLEQVVRYASEIADALNKAHRQGITHRDLKPDNIMLTKSGAKLLDFGLAKLRTQPPPVAADLTELTAENTKLTADGVLLGTFQYMAPEQLEGAETDARTDIFALGCVMYEMATGKTAFTGKTRASLIAAILASEPPPISSLQPLTPPALERVVKTCLAKDPDERWQAVHDVKLQLKWIAEGGSQAGTAVTVSEARKWRLLALMATALLLAICIVGVLSYLLRKTPERQVTRSYILPPENWTYLFSSDARGAAVISPDGTQLAFVAQDQSGKQLLWVRPLDSLSGRALSGSDGASYPFWSPDSRFIGFFAEGKLKKIAAAGGVAQSLCDAPNGRGGSWGRKGDIVFAPASRRSIYRVLESGGTAVPVTKVSSSASDSQRWPFFLPDGIHFLYISGLAGGIPGTVAEINIGSVDGMPPKEVLSNLLNAVYAPPGYLLFVRDGVLMAQPFDPDRLQLTGDALPILESVASNLGFQKAIFSVSENGILAYQAGSGSGFTNDLIWMDRIGKQLAKLGDTAAYFGPRISPDGKHVAVEIFPPGKSISDLWIYDLARPIKTRLTFDSSVNRRAAWSPDGSRIRFSSSRSGHQQIYEKATNGVGGDELVAPASSGEQVIDSWSPDGKFVAYDAIGTAVGTSSEIWILPTSGDRKPSPFLQSKFDQIEATFSPDGKWLAYSSNESGSNEIYLTPFPAKNGKWQVSTNGGSWPAWRRDGKEIFYLRPDKKLMSAEISTNGITLTIGTAKPLFQTNAFLSPNWPFDVAPDGKRFLVNAVSEPTSSARPITLVVNWDAKLRK
jgi:eukaryotic-like serine/threonine-protein kinase